MLRLAPLRAAARPFAQSRALSSRASSVLSSLDLPTSGQPINGVFYDAAVGWTGSGEVHKSVNPTTGEVLAEVRSASKEDVDKVLKASRRAYEMCRTVPAPKRGEVLRQIRVAMNERIEDLGKLVSLEMGKVLSGKSRLSRSAKPCPDFTCRSQRAEARCKSLSTRWTSRSA